MATKCVAKCDTKSSFSSGAMLQCAGVSPRISEEVAAKYVDQVSNPAPGKFAAPTRCYALACVRAGRLIYAKKNWSGTTGDCPAQVKEPSAGSKQITANVSRIAASGTGALLSSGVGSSVSTAGVVSATAIGTALGTATFGLGAIALLFGIFGAHERAVKVEQELLCNAVVGYNNFADWIEGELRAGNISVQDAITQLRSIRQSVAGNLAAINKSCNFSCGLLYALDSLVVWNEQENYAMQQSTVGKVKELAINPLTWVAAGLGLLVARRIF